MANGTMNPFEWNYKSGKTWGYMAGGAIAGAISGAVGAGVAGSGIPFANTAGIATSSFLNSIGTNIYTSGEADFNLSIGAVSYNFSNGSFGYLGKSGNSSLENIGYGFGALANIQDLSAAIGGGTNITVESRPKLTGHSQIDGKGILISVGPNGDPYTTLNGMKCEYAFFKEQMHGRPYPGENVLYIKPKDAQFKTTLRNVNRWAMKKFTDKLTAGKKLIGGRNLTYGVFNGCVNYTSRALYYSGVLNVNALLPITAPVLLNAELGLRQLGIYANPYLTNSQ